MPLHVVDGIGDPLGWLRDPLPVREAALRLANDAGRGNSSYQNYDDKITAAAVDWLKARAASSAGGKPWVLFVSLVCPHFPLIARPEWYDLYPEDKVPLPALYDAAERQPDHPYIAAIRECQIYDRAFDDGEIAARARRLFRARQLCRRQCRQADAARSPRPVSPTRRGCSIRRPRRQSRHAPAVGQIDDVRGIGRGADDPRRARGAARLRLPRAGVAGRCLPDDRRMRRRCRRIPTTATCPAPRCSTWRAARRRGARSCQRIPRDRRGDRRLHDPQGSVQIRLLRRHAAAAVRPRRRPAGDAAIWRASRAIRGSSPIARRSCAGSSIPTPPTRWRRPTSGRASPRSAGARRSSQRGSFGYSPAPGTKPVYN